jgi:hypothetical protein
MQDSLRYLLTAGYGLPASASMALCCWLQRGASRVRDTISKVAREKELSPARIDPSMALMNRVEILSCAAR